MKNRISLLGIIAILAIIGLGFTACGGDDDTGGNNGNTTVAVTGITVAPTTLTLTVGGSTGTLTATVAPSNATDKAVTWSTSNAAVATVSDGIVTAVSAGTATITVTTTDGSKTATCAITVTQAVTDVRVAPTTLALNVGGSTGTLTATIAPSNATNKAVTWSTSNAAVATVSNGIVTAVSVGTATIMVITTDGSHTATCEVTVTHTHNNWDWATYTSGSGPRECQTDGCTMKAGVGDTGPAGGKIFYANEIKISVYGANYLEAAPTNQATSVNWSSTHKNVSGATGTATGTGKANTAAIIASHSSDMISSYAAEVAVAYTGGDKNDWFLPSRDELNEMYKARTHLGISSGWFWSSSQGSIDRAWGQNFINGRQDDFVKGINNEYVRAVRAF